MIASRRPSRFGGPRKNRPCVSSARNCRVLGDAVEEVRADRQHDAQRARRVVGDGGEARRERGALGRIGDLRVELLELIDEQQDAPVVAARAAAQQVTEVAGLLAQLLGELLLLVELVGEVRGGRDHRRDQRRERLHRLAAGTDDERLPRLAASA